MLKKFLISLGAVLLLSFTSCGGESSKEARELLNKILQLVGIPHDIVVNICQDANQNGVCGAGELFTKVTIKKGESIEDIWHKIALTDDGKYFLETYDVTLPILLEVQDSANLDFDDSKITLTFNGFETKEENETKELSILESMVDANALTKNIADKFRTLDNSDAQDKYYSALFNTLETNINILRREDLNKTEAIKATIKEMADETKTNQEQVNKINNCENNQTCVDEEIKNVSDELIISDEEIVEIKGGENNGSTPTHIDSNTSYNQKQNFILPRGVMRDEVAENTDNGESIPNFIDLSEMSVNVTDTNIIIEITLVELPQLVFNQKEITKINFIEYMWSIKFDINNDALYSSGDLSFRIFNAKFENTKEKLASILDANNQHIYVYNDNGGHDMLISKTINSYISTRGNKIIFNIPKLLHNDLKKITPSTKVRFETSYNIGNNYYGDSYPL